MQIRIINPRISINIISLRISTAKNSNPQTKYIKIHNRLNFSFIWHYLIFMLYIAICVGCYQPVATFESIGLRSDSKLITNNNIKKEKSNLDHNKDIKITLSDRQNKDGNEQSSKNPATQTKTELNQQYPFIFYKECNKSGFIWLYECQRLGIESIYDAFKLEIPQTKYLHNITMFYHVKESFIRYEVLHNGQNTNQ
ncbi:Uncharacterised protein [Helicobacter muridarum]|nr:Uncharacterised protein [Helicobacter muridarum]